VEVVMGRILMRPIEVAEALGIGRSTAYGLLASGAIPSIRVGRQLRVPADELAAWVKAQVGKRVAEELHADRDLAAAAASPEPTPRESRK
jgi:excisionase family DNA binding protein